MSEVNDSPVEKITSTYDVCLPSSQQTLTVASVPAGFVAIIITELGASKIFALAESLITKYSPYFSAAFNGSFREADEHIIELKDVNIETFEHVVKWLKHETHFNTPENDYKPPEWNKRTKNDEGKDEDIDEEYIKQGPLWIPTSSYTFWLMAIPAIQVYIFADKYNTPILRNDAIDRLFWCIIKSRVSSCIHEEVTLAYEHTAANSPLRRLLVDAFCTAQFFRSESPETMRRYPKEFLVDVMFKNADAKFIEGNRKPNLILKSCNYHEHDAMSNACMYRIKKF